jgi:hypothetical protein
MIRVDSGATTAAAAAASTEFSSATTRGNMLTYFLPMEFMQIYEGILNGE